MLNFWENVNGKIKVILYVFYEKNIMKLYKYTNIYLLCYSEY